MLLLVIGDEFAQYKKELYIDNLPVDGIIVSHSLDSANQLIKSMHPEVVFIHHLVLEDIELQAKELKKINNIYDGAIIAKVDSDLIGLRLMKQNLITDYFIAAENKEEELANLKKCFNTAVTKTELNKSLESVTNTLCAVKKMEKRWTS